MSNEKDGHYSDRILPHRDDHTGFALYCVVQSELQVAAARAMTVYGKSMTRERFLSMAAETYDNVEVGAKAFCDLHKKRRGCSVCQPVPTGEQDLRKNRRSVRAHHLVDRK